MLTREEQEAWEQRKNEIRSKHPRLFPRPVGISCPPVWAPILEDVFRELEEAAERMGLEDKYFPVISDVKEKYGTLRIYFHDPSPPGDDTFDSIVDRAEARTEETCVVCGEPGKITEGGLWCYCDAHRPAVEDDLVL
ncbi:MAG TPA: hypothetical protein VK979_05400 [Guyparkeria sp.]|nr:hypothetical protein [Guyparkeria sp.]